MAQGFCSDLVVVRASLDALYVEFGDVDEEGLYDIPPLKLVTILERRFWERQVEGSRH